MTTTAPQDTAVRRFLIAALGLPALFTAAGVALQLWARPDLPETIATHWGGDGRPDGFGSPTTALVLTAIVSLGVPAVLTALCLPALRRGDRGPSYRFLGATMAGLSGFLVTLTTWLTVMQRGLEHGRDAGNVWWALADATLNAAIFGYLGWRLQPHTATVTTAARQAETLDLAPGERVAWMRDTTIRRPWAVLATVVTAALAIAALVAWLTSDSPAAAVLTVAGVALTAALLATTAFHVRVDTTGLTVRAWGGLPRFHVPLADIEQVTALESVSFGEYGGFGIRWVPNRLGIILHTGQALQVTRRSGRVFAVTVDDAATAAATLEALRTRSA